MASDAYLITGGEGTIDRPSFTVAVPLMHFSSVMGWDGVQVEEMP